MVRSSRILAFVLAASGGLALLNCASETSNALPPIANDADAAVGGETNPNSLEAPFEPASVYSAVSKVKSILTSLPVTDDEISTVQKSPELLEQLVDAWAWSPEGEAKMLNLLTLSFQQTQVTTADFVDLFGGSSLPGGDAMLANAQQSFARTALEIVKSNRPFTDTLTTDTVMLTPALMSMLALIDLRRTDDAGKITDKWYSPAQANPFTVENTTPIALAESVDPNSANYMKFYTTGDMGAGCTERVFTANRDNSMKLAAFLTGTLQGIGQSGDPCNSQKNVPAIFAPEDFTTWKMVKIQKPTDATTPRSAFWDLPSLRTGSTLTLDVPRIGFFTTPAFQANWRTNTSNQMRVTVNQSLIVALGTSFDSETSTVPASETGLDAQHADPSTPCYQCHKLLDPMRSFFRRNLTLNYHEQLDPVQTSAPASFSFGTVQATGGTLNDFAAAMQQHPAYPSSWAQKLCYYADSANCSLDDPEFLRVVAAFKDSNYDFRVLVRKMFSSPLVTGLAHTKTFDDREIVVSIARYDHFCRALGNRLGVDGCNISKTATQIAQSVPRDSYGRGSEAPVLTSDVSLFFRTSVENICREISTNVVDGPANKYSSKDVDGALTDFVHTLMNLPDSDPRSAPALQILKEHNAAALTTPNAKATDALRSTFILACSSPSSISIGL